MPHHADFRVVDANPTYCRITGVPLEELIQFLLEALRPHEAVLGLGTPG